MVFDGKTLTSQVLQGLVASMMMRPSAELFG
jgi:hypothetical protein